MQASLELFNWSHGNAANVGEGDRVERDDVDVFGDVVFLFVGASVIIISTIVITGIYVRRANNEYDALTAEILKDATK